MSPAIRRSTARVARSSLANLDARESSFSALETENPQAITDTIASVREAVVSDTYLKAIPSVAKSVAAFHAKDDCPEVRMLLYRALAPLQFSAQVVVARKFEPMFRMRFQGSQDRFYDDLVARLFENRLHRFTNNRITFARRGNKTRQHALRAAIDAGIRRFEKKWKTDIATTTILETSQPMQEPLLQAVDYTNWAVFRAFERGEMRYFDYLREHFELIVDIFDKDKYSGGGNWYTRDKNPFDIKKASPLG
jgi:hypothetical protein